MISALTSFIASLGVSRYASSFWSDATDWRGIAASASIMLAASVQLWALGPNPYGFGMVIGSGWYFLNKSIDIILPD